MKRHVSTGWAIAVAAVAAMIAPATHADQGVTDNEVVIGTHQDLSGPITFWGVPVKNGMQLAVEEINAKGGIHGRKLKLVVEDSGYDPKRAVLATQKMLTRDEIFVMAGPMGTPTVLASMPLVLRKRLPHVFPLTAAQQMYEPFNKYKFALFPPYYHGMRATTKWMVEQNAKKRVCILYQDDEFGLNSYRGVVDQLKAMNMELAAETTYKRGATDFSSQIARLQAANCDLVTLGTVIRETVGAMAEARKIGWNVDFLVCQAGYAPEVALLGKGIVEGLYGVAFTPIPYYDTASDEVKAWMNRYKATYDVDANIQAAAGYQVITLTALAMQNAGRELTAESFVKGVEQIRDYRDMFGSTPISFGPQQRLASESTFLSQVRNGRWETVTGELKF
jgi:ABC-type branched-subunit amino acid transport system substrate-binding protein